jgi:hypothetical protein
MVDDTAHYAVARLEVRDRRAKRHNSPGAFVRAGTGEICAHYPVLDHKVGVAEGSDGDADEEVFGCELGRYGNSVYLVRFVELRKLEVVIA